MSISPPGPRTIVVTGGARGIGEATARLLAGRGNRVVIADIDTEAAGEAASRIGGRSSGHQLDVSDRDAFEAFIEMVDTEIGPIDVLVNNAGIADASASTVEQDPAMTDRMLSVNLNGVIYGTLAVLKRMELRNSGHVINVASLAGIAGVRGLPVYSASKFGVVGFTESIRAEYEGTGIVFTCVMPGPVATGMMDGTRETPLVKLVSPETIALAIGDAIESRKARVSVPGITGFLARVSSLLPPAVAIRLNHMIGLDRVYTEIDEEARSGYTSRITSS